MNTTIRHDETCPIWRAPASVERSGHDDLHVDSPRTAGKYFISRTAIAILKRFDDQERARVTTWLIEQREDENDFPRLSADNIREIAERPEMSIEVRADRILEFMKSCTKVLGDNINFFLRSDGEDRPIEDDSDLRYLELLAWSECVGEQDCRFLLSYLNDKRWIGGYSPGGSEQACSITVMGHGRLEELTRGQR